MIPSAYDVLGWSIAMCTPSAPNHTVSATVTTVEGCDRRTQAGYAPLSFANTESRAACECATLVSRMLCAMTLPLIPCHLFNNHMKQ